jgi:N-acetyl-gamma-glutamyl-phosphate reductase
MPAVGVAGYQGYSGRELVQLLKRHPHVDPVLLSHRDAYSAPVPIGHPAPRTLACTREVLNAEKFEAVFLATPHDVSMELATWILEAGVRVIDLSGAFRFRSASTYERWYKERHRAPELLELATYGLPEFCRGAIAKSRFVANPGCYPTAANLALKPLIEAGVIDRTAGIVCDAKSGVSGAGRKPSLKTSFCEVTENFSAYAVLEHRHVPEILLTSAIEEAELSFTAQLLPIDRGILETIYFRASGVSSPEELLDVYQRRYAGEPFVRLYKPGSVPDLHAVMRTNYCDIGFQFDKNTARTVLISVIDNLGKGAAGQAIQNMNLMLGFPETAGLL